MSATPSSPGERAFVMPPLLRRSDGRERCVGVEVEFSGLGVDAACDIVRDVFGGSIESEGKFGSSVKGARFGDYRVEIDSSILKEQRYRAFLAQIGLESALGDLADDVLGTALSTFVPTEIVMPPIALADLWHTEAICRELRARRAEGTRASIVYTFGFQLNPDLPALDAPTFVRYLRAFLALHDWLFAVVDVDLARRITSFVDPFPPAYRELVLDASYAPDLHGLIDDYLTHNPTRNRALDMLPSFAMIERDEVIGRAREHDQVKARPTFHYRLPNCLVDDERWSFALEWNRWVEVERLAEDAGRLREVSAAALATLGKSLSREEALALGASWGVTAP